MKFPSLVRKQFCKTPVEVTIYGEGLTEDGAPIILFECKKLYPSNSLVPSDIAHAGQLMCNYQSKLKTVYTAQQKKVQCNGVLLFPTDFAPNIDDLSGGYVVINGVKREIVQSVKARNPDGTVNFIELDVM